MSRLAYSIEVGAVDKTGPGLGSALSSLSRFTRSAITKPITVPIRLAQSAMGFARDFQMGIRPLLQAIDQTIEKGTALEAIRKGFENLTGKSGQDAKSLAQYLVDASSGMMRMSEAMALANRALGPLTLEQLATAIEFIGKKSVATGKDAKQALDTVITGLVRGSTLFLDDFGILVDGIDGVKRSFEAIHGKGAFDALGPAAQKAEIIRQALAEMQGQMGKLGITGRETVFTWASIKNQIGDATDELFAAVGRSDALRESLVGVRDTIAGVSEHLRQGGSFGDVLFGKNNGAGSGGLLGGLRAGLLDLAEVAGIAFSATLIRAGGEFINSLADGWEWLRGKMASGWELLKNDISVFVRGLLPEDKVPVLPFDNWQDRVNMALKGGNNPQRGPAALLTPPGSRPVAGGFGSDDIPGAGERWGDRLIRTSDEMLQGLYGFLRLGEWRAQFAKEFPAPQRAAPPEPAAPPARKWSWLDPNSYPVRGDLYADAQKRDQDILDRLDREIYREKTSSERKEKYVVARETNSEVARLRRAGVDVQKPDIARIREEVKDEIVREREDRLAAMFKRREKVFGRIYDRREEQEARKSGPIQEWRDTVKTDKAIGEAAKTIQENVSAAVSLGVSVMSELFKINRRLSTAGPKRS